MIVPHLTLPSQTESVPDVPGLAELQALSLGDARIRIAVLDGPVDTSHACFAGARLSSHGAHGSLASPTDAACLHGTHVASVLFGQPGSGVHGVAPGCTGLLIRIFEDERGRVRPCSQLDLARAILESLERGAHVINISGGQPAVGQDAEPLLVQAIAQCAKRNVLVLAAAGNDGCACLHVPASIASALAVGAINHAGQPLDSSNWGRLYRRQGVMALGANVLGARCGGGVLRLSGTSFSTPIVSGIAGLLLSLQLRQNRLPDPHGVRAVLLRTALPCTQPAVQECQRFLAGTLNVPATTRLILEGTPPMSEHDTHAADAAADQPHLDSALLSDRPVATMAEAVLPAAHDAHRLVAGVDPALPALPGAEPDVRTDRPVLRVTRTAAILSPRRSGIEASGECGCSTNSERQPLVYALGTLGYDYGSRAQRDSFAQAMPLAANEPDIAEHLLAYLKDNQHEAQSVIWTLNLDATPIYAIAPTGAYSELTYQRLREYLAYQLSGAELASIPGHVSGKVRLASGQLVPLLVPAVRGMYSWSTDKLVDEAFSKVNSAAAKPPADKDAARKALRSYLSRIYYGLRNLGVTPQERALNYSATNAFQAAQVMMDATQGDSEISSVDVSKSPVCRPDSDCYDVQLRFFNPSNTNIADRVFRFTVDVSEVIPVSIGSVRSWSVRA